MATPSTLSPRRGDRSRPVISSSWQRSARSGLTPGSSLHAVAVQEVDPDAPLLRAARPVLDELAETLTDTRLALLLADRSGCVVARRFGEAGVADVFDRRGAVVGRRLDEATSGTNAIATALAVASGVAVVGGEHYLETLRDFTCYGQPIHDPVTGALVGVLDVTGPAGLPTQTLAPLARLGARGIQRRLLAGAGDGRAEILAAFHAASGRRDAPVAVVGLGQPFGDDVVLTNGLAAALLAGPDHALLRRTLRTGGPAPGEALVLSGGRVVTVQVLVRLTDAVVVTLTERPGTAQRPLTPLERAEHDVIAATMDSCGGNKAMVAARLGISRTTLYKRLRTLGIPG